MSPYLVSNKRTELSKIIFKIRSQTLDIKQWQPWKYQNDFCVKCEKYTETMDHFVKGPAIKKFMPLVVIIEAHDALRNF
jgi:hypothetical protein